MLYGFERLGVKCDIADAKLLLARHDADLDSKLGFWEFANMFLPADNIVRDELERRKAVWEVGFETKELIRRHLRRLLDQEGIIEGIRQRISREHNVNIRKAYNQIDHLERGFITFKEL